MPPDTPSVSEPPTAPSRPAVGERMNRGAVLWVTLAVFAQEAVWNFYDAQVPEQLRHYFPSAGVIGLIMGLDHSWGIFTQPSVGFLSDKLARRRTGRWPIVLVGAALAAVPFVLIPWATNLPALMVCVVGFAAVANAFKGVTETLVTDYVAPSARGKAQGFIKAGVSLTIVVSSVISLLVVDRSLHLAFVIPPLLMLIVLGLSWAFLGRKVSLPRPTVQGGPHDTDCYAGQQYAPLMDMEIAWTSRGTITPLAGVPGGWDSPPPLGRRAIHSGDAGR
ncbi:MFS transporter [Streptomyces sp. MK37H]|nr:MFS transporter [Streptomyces sp. MK37H]